MSTQFTQTSLSAPVTVPKRTTKKPYVWPLIVMGASLMIGGSISAQATGLAALFSDASSTASPEFLPVEKAFQVSTNTVTIADGIRLTLNFDITPGHYVYQNKIKLTLPDGVTATPWRFSQSPVSIDDPTFGTTPVFDQAIMVATTMLTQQRGEAINDAALVIGWQGCAKAGLCYPPEKIHTTIDIAAIEQPSTKIRRSISSDTATMADTETATTANVDTDTDTDTATIASLANAPVIKEEGDTDRIKAVSVQAKADGVEDTVLAVTDPSVDKPVVTQIRPVLDETIGSPAAVPNDAATAAPPVVDGDPFGLGTHPSLALMLLFVAGLGLALTPCVLPMLPIVANLVAREKKPSVRRGVALTSSYAIGVATAYGLLGALIAVFGESLGVIGWLQNPVILIGFAIVFVLLAFYMLGVFSIRLPRGISSKMQGLSQSGDGKLGSIGGSLLVGFLSALVVSPCVSAPLFGALLAVSTIGSPLLGFAALFMLGFGLSAPLILIGATQGRLMPKAGAWMDWIKQGFALLLFAVALLLIERVLVSPMMLMVWALWFMVVAIWAWRWLGKGRILTQACGSIAGVWAICLVVGAALGNDDALHPLASLNTAPMSPSAPQPSAIAHDAELTVTTLAALDALIAAHPNVLVDVTAAWCIECRIIDKNLFYNRPAQMQGWQLVKLDITETTADSKAILARYKLFGPPALLYYQAGQLVSQQVGDISRSEFEQTLTQLYQNLS